MNYSQTGEQEIILDYFGDQTGRFLEIGAYDGKTFSNTRALAENGWTGVWVEPGAAQFDALVGNSLPGVEMVHALVGDKTELRKFHYTRDAVSTTEDKHRQVWQQHATFYDTFTVQVSVKDLMQAFPPPYDLISIDTEGTSLRLLGLLEPYLGGTKLIVVEHDGHHVEVPGFVITGQTPNNLILGRVK